MKTVRERAREWVEAQEGRKTYSNLWHGAFDTLLIQFLCDEIDRLERKLEEKS